MFFPPQPWDMTFFTNAVENTNEIMKIAIQEHTLSCKNNNDLYGYNFINY